MCQGSWLLPRKHKVNNVFFIACHDSPRDIRPRQICAYQVMHGWLYLIESIAIAYYLVEV